jgi:hypothetical protein
MLHYMLPNPLHAPESITCSRIHYMLPNPLHAPESITCSRIHYMLPNPLHGITFFGIHYMHLLSLHGIYMPSQHVSCISRPAQTGTAIAGPSSISSTHVDAAGTADPGPAASTIAFPPLRYVFNAVLSASRLDE